MKSYLARENSIWNMMFFGKSHQVKMLAVPSLCGRQEEQATDEKKLYFDNEKHGNSDYVPIEVGADKKKGKVSKWGCILLMFVFLQTTYNLVQYWRLPHSANYTQLTASEVVESKNLIDLFDGLAESDDVVVAPKQILEVTYPFLQEDASLGAPVFQSLFINHTFGNSWGSPAIAKISAPSNVTYNKVVLTLNTTVGGVQYDRLANIFVDGVQIWRTSTAEPGGKDVFSTFDKDVSTYLNLFQQSEFEVLFQLDNLITPRLTGQFHVELYATYFNVLELAESEEKEGIIADSAFGNFSKYSILSTDGAASKVYGLTKHEKSTEPSISYLPSDKILVSLPEVSVNTTRLTLSVFASGNSAEEFWYTNVLDKFVHQFENVGKKLLGHGPVRIINVYFNGEKIATQTPEPFIFTGGISPALWSPVVATSAFDLSSIDIDLTGLLPYLWESQSIADKFLEIEISNGLDEIVVFPPIPKSGIAENWITSANLLTYESDQVASVEGSVVSINDTKTGSAVGLAPPFSGTILQVISANFGTTLNAILNYTLIDGTSVNTNFTLYTESKTTNIQKYQKFGEKQSLVHVGKSKQSSTFLDNDVTEISSDEMVNAFKKKKKLAPNTIQQVNKTATFPVIATLNETEYKTYPADEVNIEYDVEIATAKDISVKVDGTSVFGESAKQNGTLTYFITSDGNHGSGSLDTKYELDVGPDFKYKRKVIAVNGTVVSDVLKGSAIFSYEGETLESNYVSLLTSLKKEHGDAGEDVFDIFSDVVDPSFMELFTNVMTETKVCKHMSYPDIYKKRSFKKHF